MPSTQYGQRKEYNITLETNEKDCNYLPNIQYFAMNKSVHRLWMYIKIRTKVISVYIHLK